MPLAKTEEFSANVFEERAEHLSRDELVAWTAETQRDRGLLKKLKNAGAKLLTGPRGSGKSTLLRRAYFELRDEKRVLPAYVNYATSLALEPLFHRQANALQIFRQWVIAKVVLGLADSLRDSGCAVPESLAKQRDISSSYIHQLETQQDVDLPASPVGPSEALSLIERWTREVGSRRCVLLLDDAAHVFSSEQQREFFEIFRSLRSRVVAPKAAVYPGITSYSPHLHIGHDAELIEAWYEPAGEEYLALMQDLLRRRLPRGLLKNLLKPKQMELVNYLALASFGLPRGFLLMVSQLLGVEEDSRRPTRRAAEQAVTAHADSVRRIFQALSNKLPRFRHFVTVGGQLERAFARALRLYNARSPPGQVRPSLLAWRSRLKRTLLGCCLCWSTPE